MICLLLHAASPQIDPMRSSRGTRFPSALLTRVFLLVVYNDSTLMFV